MQVGFRSDKGRVRSNNEDAVYVLLPNNTFILCDGVGGGNSGEIASRTAVTEIAKKLQEEPIQSTWAKEQIVAHLQSIIEVTNEKIYNMALSHSENTGMATTLAMICFVNGKAYIANIGDSRVYIIRQNRLLQLTEDHTYLNSLVKAGVLTKAQADKDERKNVITKAVGCEKTVEADYFLVESKPEDIYLICSDGLYGEVTAEDIIRITQENESMSEVCGKLVSKANENGGRDNISCIAVKIGKED